MLVGALCESLPRELGAGFIALAGSVVVFLSKIIMPYHNPIPERRSSSKTGIGFQSLVQAEKLLQVAFVLPSAMVIGWLAGAWADSKLHQSWLTVVGIIFGCISGLFYVIRLALDAERAVGPVDSPGKKGNGPDGSQ